MFFWLMTYVQLSWEFGRYMSARRTVGQDRQKCKETSSPPADKQQKTADEQNQSIQRCCQNRD